MLQALRTTEFLQTNTETSLFEPKQHLSHPFNDTPQTGILAILCTNLRATRIEYERVRVPLALLKSGPLS